MNVKSLSETGMAQNTVVEIQGESKCFMKCVFSLLRCGFSLKVYSSYEIYCSENGPTFKLSCLSSPISILLLLILLLLRNLQKFKINGGEHPFKNIIHHSQGTNSHWHMILSALLRLFFCVCNFCRC